MSSLPRLSRSEWTVINQCWKLESATAREVHDLVVADGRRGVALAGVMGGADSEVGEGTTDVTTGIPFYDHMLDQLGRHGGAWTSFASHSERSPMENFHLPSRLITLFNSP